MTFFLTGVDGFGGSLTTEPAALTDDAVVFTVVTGPIRITDLLTINNLDTDPEVNNVTMRWKTLAGTFTGISASFIGSVHGNAVYCDFTTLNTAPVLTTTGLYLHGTTAATGGGVVLPAGAISLTVANGPSTSVYRHFMRWIPLGYGASVIVGSA